MSVLQTRGLTRDFGVVRALDDVTLRIAGGEVVSVVGENGAGKSTLLDLLSGVERPSAGTIELDDAPAVLPSYRGANDRGIWRIFQDPALIPGLAVYENLLLGHESRFTRLGVLDRRSMVRRAQDLVTSMQLDVDVRQPLMRYDTATRQALEVVRAGRLPALLGLPAGHVLFDEPTTGLTRSEVERLLQLVRALRADGTGVAFVSHRLDEVLAISDRIVVMKDGRVVAETTPADTSEDELHRLMVGRERIADFYVRDRAVAPGDVVLGVRGLTVGSGRDRRAHVRRQAVRDASLQVRAGEIVGVAGLLGSGKSDLARAVAGVVRTSAGDVRLHDRPLSGGVARRKRRGVAFVSGDRANESVVRGFSVAANVSLASGESDAHGFTRAGGLWRARHERREAVRAIDEYGIKAGRRSVTGHLSGGNQQKVALARWVRREPEVIVIENPTAGVDVGAKQEIYRVLREAAARGTAVLYVSDELPELLGFGDRVLVMRDGSIVDEVATGGDDGPTERQLVASMVGGRPADTGVPVGSTA